MKYTVYFGPNSQETFVSPEVELDEIKEYQVPSYVHVILLVFNNGVRIKFIIGMEEYNKSN